MLLLTMLSGTALAGNAQEDMKAITSVIQQFAKAGDEQNVEMLEKVLHPNYRVLWNMPEKGTTSVLDRETYLNLVREKKIGGDARSLTLESVELINGGNALIKVSMKGGKANFQSLYSIIKDQEGNWLLVQDQVFMEVK